MKTREPDTVRCIRAMKILLTVHQFLPEHFSGTEVLTLGVAKELTRLGHQVFVLTGFPTPTRLPDEVRFDEYVLDGIQVFRFHHTFVPMGGQSVVHEIEYDNHLAARYLAFIIKKVSPELVHFFHLSRLGAGLVDVALAAGIPAYYTPTDFWSVCPTGQLLLDDGNVCRGPSGYAGNCVKHVVMLTRGPRVVGVVRQMPNILVDMGVRAAMARLLPKHQLTREVAAMGRRRGFIVSRLNALHGIFSPSALMTEVLVANGVDLDLITPLSFGIDLGRYSGNRRQPPRGGPLIFGFIGTLGPHKGCKILIEAFKTLKSSGAKLKIYGSPLEFPDYFADLEKQAADFNAIEFCGTFPNADIVDVLAGLDALVVPSLWYENTPLVIYSAMAAKCPVVASDFPGMTEVVKDGRNGLTFAPGDAQALRTALNRLVEEPGLLSRLSAGCKPPKSTVTYVAELLEAYSRRRALASRRCGRALGRLDLQPIHPAPEECAYVSGWAATGFATPVRVSAYAGETLVAQSDCFSRRPDVRNTLRRWKATLTNSEFGFTLMLPAHTVREQVSLRLEASNGRMTVLALEEIACGHWVELSNGNFIGLDAERFQARTPAPAEKQRQTI